jgi:3D (Asp-Asp-Asp) domain-containing protein
MTAELSTYTGIDDGQRGDDITASGTRARAWVTCAAWSELPFGTRIEVPALGRTFIVEDRGGAIGYGKIDVYVGHANIDDALKFGRQRLEVKIYPPGR